MNKRNRGNWEEPASPKLSEASKRKKRLSNNITSKCKMITLCRLRKKSKRN
jgi:hypothetical protein